MIEKLTISNFKTLKHLELECSNLNLLTGLNGMGKSSVLQALLLLRQSHLRGMLVSKGLTLKGDLVNIGTGKDAFYEFADQEVISFGIKMQEAANARKWEFAYSLNDESGERKFDGSDVLPYLPETERPVAEDDEPLFGSAFQYLHANRFVLNEYPRSDFHVVQNRSVGTNGEYAAHFLEHYADKIIVDEQLRHKDAQSPTLGSQVDAWMGEVSPGTTVHAEKIPGVESVSLRYKSYGVVEAVNALLADDLEKYNPITSTRADTPLNMGFGVTYSLSVIVALLAAKKDDLILIENPEAHLHPRGQSMLGRLMVRAAGIGAQLFIESHSDHVLNGIRVAVKEGVPANAVRINFFQRNEKDQSTSVEYPILENTGRLTNWPVDFFDQMDKDFEILFK